MTAELTPEVVHQSLTSLIVRLPLASGESIVHKAPLGPNAMERLRHESRMLARLAGVAGVPQLVAVAHPPDVIAMQDCGGPTLAQAIHAEPTALPLLLQLALQLAQVIAAMHERGVLHRDINPNHILLCGPQQRPVLIDFELATTVADGQPGFIHHREIPGTLAYLAPEQTGRTGRNVDQRSDLYALGATLYEAACGRPPFEASDPLQLIHDHLAKLPTPPAELEPRVPRALSDIILRLLEKEPDHRYQSAEGLAHDLTLAMQARAQGNDGPLSLGERDFAWRLSPPSRLVGREREIAALRRSLDEAIGNSGSVVFVAGGPGVGKTSLINELRPMVAAHRGWFVSGKFDQYRSDAPSATIQALRALGQLLLAEPQMELARQRERILEFLGTNAGLITGGSPEFALLLGPQPEVIAVDPVQTATRALLSILDLLRALVSPDRPLVMVLDDVQWAHGISIRFIDTVLHAEKIPGLLLVCAFRDAEVEATHPLSAALPRWARLEHAPVLLRLSNLPQSDLGVLLAEMLRMPMAQAALLAQAIEPHTGGNPYDTVELLNALRREGALLAGPTGWRWDEARVRNYIGQGSVVDLVSARIDRLPPEGAALVQAVACLGGEVALSLLRTATGVPASMLDEQLAAPLEDGLLISQAGDDGPLRLRHDRVQQAAYDALRPAQRLSMHLSFARRLAPWPAFRAQAAAQYLTAIAAVHAPDERRIVARLLHEQAIQTRRLTNYVTVERYLTAAIRLLDGLDNAADRELRAVLEIEQHAALYSLGRLEEADAVYRSIESRGGDALDLVEPTCVQVSSLTNRKRPRDAVNLGLTLLRQLGLDVPIEDMGANVAARLDAFCRWVEQDTLEEDLKKIETHDRRVILTAKLIARLVSPAVFCDQMVLAWLTMESQRLWTETGPSAAAMGLMGCTPFVSISLRQDYRAGYNAVRRVLAVGRARGYEAATSMALFRFATYCAHWFEPLENTVPLLRESREGLLRAGDLQLACLTHYTAVKVLFDCAPTLEEVDSEIESGLGFAARTGNDHANAVILPHRQLVNALRAEMPPTGHFTDVCFDEATRLKCMGAGPAAASNFHIFNALGCVLFSDMPGLTQHVAAGLQVLPYQHSMYAVALAHFLRAMALAERVKAAGPGERSELLGELEHCHRWLALRAADCPTNFLHLLKLVEAERAWSVGDPWSAACAFDAAVRESEASRRPWHAALISERAGLFHMAQGQEHAATQLLGRACSQYSAWGASAKVRQLEQTHAFLQGKHPTKSGPDPDSRTYSADSIDALALLRASQALSSETSLAQLKARVVELLRTLTGATAVQFVHWSEDAKGWLVSDPHDHTLIRVEEAGRRGLLPLSAFRYAERTREPLAVDDARRDDRFARDPYVEKLSCCSLLIVPILNQGVLRAILLLENQLSRSAFLADRLEAVMLIAGQLAVSLENALLYGNLDMLAQQRQLALDAARMGSWHYDALTGSSRCDKRFSEIYGVDANELTHEQISERLHPEDAPALWAAVAAALDPEDPKPYAIEYRVNRLDGEMRWVEAHGLAVFEEDAQGRRRATSMVGTVADITERKRAEQVLRDNQQLLQSTMEHFPTEIAYKDSEGRYLDVNSAVEKVVGMSRDQLRGLTAYDVMPEEAADVLRQRDVEVMRSRRATQEEKTRQLPTGTYIYFDTSFPLIDAQGQVYGTGHISHDITSLKRAEVALHALNEQLREADRRKDEFLAMLAHELRNPLSAICTAAEVIRLREPADSAIQRARGVVQRQVLHLSRLVDDLLDVSRITRGNVQLRQETLDLGDVAMGAAGSLTSALQAAGLTLEPRIGRPPPVVRGDATRLAQCILNLLDNALKFTPRGGRIILRVLQEGPLAVVEVSDSGIGLIPASLERIFEPFVQEQPSGWNGNSGLGVGLALTRKLVELHGGTIRAASEGLGHGSVFRIELPIADAALLSHSQEPIAALEGAGVRVLVVDDNADAAEMLSQMLVMSGFDCTVAYDGEQALCKAELLLPDAALLDIGLPDFDGYELCRRIRRASLKKQPVLIALTGWGQDKDKEQAVAAGFDGHLTKPADPGKVEALLAKLLAQPAR
ncbi:PAS domain S-box protein [Ramlibacter sp. WS9]|nr:PAS domain S-box protein [Ramlibacter sp. WS9]